MKDILTLGIESSCDETSVAVVKNGREVLSNVINSQIKILAKELGVREEFIIPTSAEDGLGCERVLGFIEQKLETRG